MDTTWEVARLKHRVAQLEGEIAAMKPYHPKVGDFFTMDQSPRPFQVYRIKNSDVFTLYLNDKGQLYSQAFNRQQMLSRNARPAQQPATWPLAPTEKEDV